MTSLTRLIRVIFFLLTGFAWLPHNAEAQQTGSIAGLVTVASGSVLPGVTVEASSPALIEKIRVVTTDGTGQYRIVDLRPGVYTVTFQLPSFSTVRRDGIELSVGFTATINAEMRLGAVEETITVEGSSPIVDIQNVNQIKVAPTSANLKQHFASIPTGRPASTHDPTTRRCWSAFSTSSCRASRSSFRTTAAPMAISSSTTTRW